MKLYDITLLLASALLLTTVSACNDDEVMQTPLETATGALDNTSFNTLSFEWDRVAGATQYSYQLEDANGHVIATEVTSLTSATITDLAPSTDYTLSVVAYAAPYGDRLNSEPLVLHGRTSDIIVLATPELTYERVANALVFTWDAVDDAEGYTYTFSKDDTEIETSTTTGTSVKFSDLENGSYTFMITADIDRPGYASSDAVKIDVDFVWVDPVAWTVTGTYHSQKLDKSWPATLVSYIDGSYSLKAWYGVEGYDLNFSIDGSNPDDMFVMSDEYEITSGYPVVNTGLTSTPKYYYIYPWDNYCWLDVENRQLGLNVYYGAYYDDLFTWGEQGGDLAGSWTMTTSTTSKLENDSYSAVQLDETVKCEITQIDSNTYQFPALYFSIWDADEAEADRSYMTVTVDWDNKTLTVGPTKNMWGYYTLAGATGAKTDIVGTINSDGSLTFTGWAGYYGSTKYVYDGTVTFTR